MSRTRNITIHDRFGNRLRARLLANGHVVLCQHAHRYTYARINRRGDLELYDDSGNFSYGCLGGGANDDAEEEVRGIRPQAFAAAA